jgi:uncharacterized YigZ family protein
MLFDDFYLTISKPSTGEYKEKGSRFKAFGYPVSSPDEVKEILKQIKKEHHQANHHCYAFRTGPDRTNYRLSDDREPSGTAGKPILNQILSADLSDILIVVARYFGGSLLGVPGLINAYKSAAMDAISHAVIIKKIITERYRISFEFEVMNEVMGLLKSYSATVIQQQSAEHCIIDFEIRKSNADELLGKINKIYKTNNPPEISILP